jgi:DNA-binding NarL/FixJ family response regulator
MRSREPELSTNASSAVTARTRVVVVDDHVAFTECLAAVIETRPDLECPASAATIAEGVALAERLTPDVILLDVLLPDGDGIAAIPRFREACPGARILILTGHMDLDILTRAASAGASGFLQKESPVDAIIRTVRAARDGAILVEQTTLASILAGLRAGSPPSKRRAIEDLRLTARELDVLNLMGEGLDPHAIAKMLVISLHTCRGYEKSIMAKLDAHSQLEAVVVASRRGLFGADRTD